MPLNLLRQLFTAVRAIVVLTVILGIAYPVLVWGIGRVAFPDLSQGSLVSNQGRVVGSRLIGQEFTGPGWFQPRPSTVDFDGLASAPSNLGPSDGDLLAAIAKRRSEIAQREHVAPRQVPPDAVTASGSGLDAYVSPAYAEIQVRRVAEANGLSRDTVRSLVAENTTQRPLGFLGDPGVNVVTLNLAISRAG